VRAALRENATRCGVRSQLSAVYLRTKRSREPPYRAYAREQCRIPRRSVDNALPVSAAPARVSVLVCCVHGVARARGTRARPDRALYPPPSPSLLVPSFPPADGCGSLVKGRVDSPAWFLSRSRICDSPHDRALDLHRINTDRAPRRDFSRRFSASIRGFLVVETRISATGMRYELTAANSRRRGAVDALQRVAD